MPVPDFSPGEVLTAAAMDSIGLWKVTTATVSGQPTLTVDNCFSANYENYRIVINMTGVSNGNTLLFRLLDSAGAPIVTNYYATAYGQDYATPTSSFATLNSTTSAPLGWLPNVSSAFPISVSMDVFRPFDSSLRTESNGLHTGINSGTAFQAGANFMARNATERARGFDLRSGLGTNITGTVRVYGYRD
jgi:hypothetical protein